jgi:hypothetical protein
MNRPGGNLTGVTNFIWRPACRCTLAGRLPVSGLNRYDAFDFLVNGRYDSNTFLRQAAGRNISSWSLPKRVDPISS